MRMPMWFFEFGLFAGSAVLTVVFFGLCSIALFPAACLVHYAFVQGGPLIAVAAVPFAYLLWGTTLCLEVVFAKRFVFFYKARPGKFPFVSWATVSWSAIGYGVLCVHTLFMQFFRSTPFMNLWLTLLGAKIGRRVNVQTTFITDWDLITIEDDAILGGDCSVVAHLVEGETIVHAPVVIKKKALVGQAASILPGVTIGERAIIGARSLVPKFKQIEDESVYAGIPVQFLKKRNELKSAEELGREKSGASA